jgi:hypothetical protein
MSDGVDIPPIPTGMSELPNGTVRGRFEDKGHRRI